MGVKVIDTGVRGKNSITCIEKNILIPFVNTVEPDLRRSLHMSIQVSCIWFG